MTVAVSGESITFADSSVQTTAATGFGFKNRIINGAMVIDQRNAGASVSTAGAEIYTVDRWSIFENGSMVFSVQQSTTVPSTAGFANSVLITTTTGAAPSAATRSQFAQFIEGFNVSDLKWGTANAASVTLSFWVRSSLTGQFGAALQNSAQDRSYPFTYTISAANTWEYETITIPGDTSGTWLTNNSRGICLTFDIGMGSDLLGTAGAWASGDKRGVTGDVQLSATTGATFYITGVQLEKGSTATSFDYRPYGTELALCQRYCLKLGGASYTAIGAGILYNDRASSYYYIKLTSTMRVVPTTTFASLIVTDRSTYDTTVSSLSTVEGTGDSISLRVLHAATGTAGYPVLLTVTSATSGYLLLSAEL
jgi:hypothetical protein